MADTDQEQQDQEQQTSSDKDEQAAAREEMKRLEDADEVPSDPSEWPDGKAKFLTFAIEDDAPFGEGPTEKLGPGSVEHHEDGSVSVNGEKVDNPEDFKGDPIPGGPTDPNAPKLANESGGTSEDAPSRDDD